MCEASQLPGKGHPCACMLIKNLIDTMSQMIKDPQKKSVIV